MARRPRQPTPITCPVCGGGAYMALPSPETHDEFGPYAEFTCLTSRTDPTGEQGYPCNHVWLEPANRLSGLQRAVLGV